MPFPCSPVVPFALVVAAASVVGLVGCDLPRDPHGTLDGVRGDTLHVGVTEHPPFVTRAGSSDEPGGVEAELIRAFADRLDAAVVWHWGTATDHVDALEQYQLDLVAAGLPAGSPLAMRVGATRPYYRGHDAIGAPDGLAVPAEWAGVPVAVPAGTALAARVEATGAVPVHRQRPGAGFAAAPEWQLRAWGLRPVERLGPDEVVLAVPPGENGFLVRLDRFLSSRQGEVAAALAREAAREPAPGVSP